MGEHRAMCKKITQPLAYHRDINKALCCLPLKGKHIYVHQTQNISHCIYRNLFRQFMKLCHGKVKKKTREKSVKTLLAYKIDVPKIE